MSEHPLDLAAITFEGQPARADIQALLDRVLQAFGLELTVDHYSRASSVLVGLRQAAAQRGHLQCTEMAILRGIAAKTDWPRWVSFNRAAAVTATAIERGVSPTVGTERSAPTRHERAQATIRPRKRR